MVKCSECGFESSEINIYCPKCGNKLNGTKNQPKKHPKKLSGFWYFIGIVTPLIGLIAGLYYEDKGNYENVGTIIAFSFFLYILRLFVIFAAFVSTIP